MRDIPLSLLEGVALHHYSVDWNHKSSATRFTEAEYFDTMRRGLQMDELVQRHSAIMDRYDPQKKVALVVDEWGGWYDVEPGTSPAFLYQQNTMRDAVLAGLTLNIFNNHCDRLRMANLAQTVNVLQAVILTEEERMLLTPTYHVMEMYAVHQDGLMLPLNARSASYTVGGSSLPAVSASASRDSDGATHVSLVNIDTGNPQQVLVDIRGASFSTVSGRVLTSEKVQDHNTFENPDTVRPVELSGVQLEGQKLRVQLPPCSVVLLMLR
jgi:alpha-N-arabinofuranosidase